MPSLTLANTAEMPGHVLAPEALTLEVDRRTRRDSGDLPFLQFQSHPVLACYVF